MESRSRGYCTPCSAVVQREYNARLRAAAIDAYGGACACCGETEPLFLTIDHVNNDGSQHRREKKRSGNGLWLHLWLQRHGYPKDGRFQILCRNCNWGKHVNGVCPHEGAQPDYIVPTRPTPLAAWVDEPTQPRLFADEDIAA